MTGSTMQVGRISSTSPAFWVMRKMRRPNPIIVCTMALALVLVGCDVNIEPTDLASVTADCLFEQTIGCRP